MSEVDVIRAWKDEEYRRSLTEAQRAALPAHPAGLVELTDGELANLLGRAGGNHTHPSNTCIIKCP
jgi:mersacidin/lichenicidin family type 2 lantibiotic